MAVVYLHGGAYSVLDKDTLTRPLFRHLAGQGHVIVDVAYRLFPETDVPGMVADAKRAVAWVKAHAADLAIRPDRVVLAGGSAGGRLAVRAGRPGSHVRPHRPGEDLRAARPAADWDAPPPAWMLRLFGQDSSRLRLPHMTGVRATGWSAARPARSPNATHRCRRCAPSTQAAPRCSSTADMTRWRPSPPSAGYTSDSGRRACP